MTRSRLSGLKILWNYYAYTKEKYRLHSPSDIGNLIYSPLKTRLASVHYVVHSINAIYFNYIRIAIMRRSKRRRRRNWISIRLTNYYHLLEVRPFSAWYCRSKYYYGTIIFSDPLTNTVYYISNKTHFIYISIQPHLIPPSSKSKTFYIWRKNLLLLNYINFYIKKFTSRLATALGHHNFFNPYGWNVHKRVTKIKWNDPNAMRIAWKLSAKINNPAYSTVAKQNNLIQEMTSLKKIWSSKIRFSLRLEFKSFKWKFFNRKWYFKFSRWRASRIFRKALLKAHSNYRKLKRNSTFVKLFQTNFNYISGLSKNELFLVWRSLRAGFNNSFESKVTSLYITLTCKLDMLITMLGFASNRYLSEEIVKGGLWAVNGRVTLDHNYPLRVGDLHQMSNFRLYKILNTVSAKGPNNRVIIPNFLYKLDSLMLLYVVRWPHLYEIRAETLLTERWLRWFVRYYPIKIRQFK